MSVGDVIVSVLDHGGQALLASALTYGVVRVRESAGQISTDERIVAELNEDLRRWVRDRNRELEIEHRLITARYNNPDSVPEWRERAPEELRHLPAGTQYFRARTSMPMRRRSAQRAALHQYRDEATLKLRAYRAQLEQEDVYTASGDDGAARPPRAYRSRRTAVTP